MKVLLFIAIIFGGMSVFISAHAQKGGQPCTSPTPTKINVIPQTKEVEYDYSLNLAQLQREQSDTVNPFGFRQKTQTRGLMRGTIRLENPDIKFGLRNVGAKGEHVCAWFEKVDIKLMINPVIVIAKEVAADSCMHKVVKTHELEHVNIDRQIVNKYSRIMGNEVNKALKQRGYAGGPVLAGKELELVNSMGEIVSGILAHQQKKMNRERVERQQALDSLDEYESISRQCPEFNRKYL